MTVGDQQKGYRGPDDNIPTLRTEVLEACIRGKNALLAGLQQLFGTGGRRNRFERFDNRATGEIALLVPAHAVCNRPDSDFRPNQITIFISGTHQSDMGRGSGHATALHVSHLGSSGALTSLFASSGRSACWRIETARASDDNKIQPADSPRPRRSTRSSPTHRVGRGRKKAAARKNPQTTAAAPDLRACRHRESIWRLRPPPPFGGSASGVRQAPRL